MCFHRLLESSVTGLPCAVPLAFSCTWMLVGRMPSASLESFQAFSTDTDTCPGVLLLVRVVIVPSAAVPAAVVVLVRL